MERNAIGCGCSVALLVAVGFLATGGVERAVQIIAAGAVAAIGSSTVLVALERVPELARYRGQTAKRAVLIGMGLGLWGGGGVGLARGAGVVRGRHSLREIARGRESKTRCAGGCC